MKIKPVIIDLDRKEALELIPETDFEIEYFKGLIGSTFAGYVEHQKLYIVIKKPS